jgi:hypothetical protein
MFLQAGLPEDQLDGVLGYFHAFDSAPEIQTLSDYLMAKATYAMMDRRLPPKEVLSPVARYVISLGARIAEWDAKVAKLNS